MLFRLLVILGIFAGAYVKAEEICFNQVASAALKSLSQEIKKSDLGIKAKKSNLELLTPIKSQCETLAFICSLGFCLSGAFLITALLTRKFEKPHGLLLFNLYFFIGLIFINQISQGYKSFLENFREKVTVSPVEVPLIDEDTTSDGIKQIVSKARQAILDIPTNYHKLNAQRPSDNLLTLGWDQYYLVLVENHTAQKLLEAFEQQNRVSKELRSQIRTYCNRAKEI